MHRTRVARVGALIAGLSLVAAACGSDSNNSSDTAASATTAASSETTAAASGTTAAGGTATTAAAGKPGEKGALEGFKGTTPLVELSDDFKAKLNAVDPKLNNTYNYAAETYDAVTIIALAAEKAKSDGIEYTNEINGITRGGTKCTDFASCQKIIASGGDPDYDGQSGPLEFSGNGEPTQASYGVQVMGANDQIDDAKTVFKTDASRDAEYT